MKLAGIISLCVFGIIFIVGGIVLQKVFPSIMESQLAGKLILREDSPTIQNFIAPPVPIFMQFYFFNVTNSEDILYGDLAILNQIGPYTYEEKRLKYDLEWSEDGQTVTYKQNKTFFFRPDMSNGLTEDDLITTLNAPLISLAAKTSTGSAWDFLTGSVMSVLTSSYDMEPFITRKAREFLYEGYDEPLLKELSKLTGNPVHATGKFGFFYPKNNSNDGIYQVYTGKNGLESLQVIDEWNNEPKLNFWSTDYCNEINGTEGSQFPQPIIPEGGRVWMYSADLCRSLYLNFEQKIMHGNLELYRYVLPFEVLEKSPATECFCTDEFTCRSSMVNLSPCKKGVPVVTSTPHFYMGDNLTINAVEGLSPNKEEHQTYVDVEPNTGVTFRAHKRIQLSMPLKRYPSTSEFDEVEEVVFPILWLNESAEVPVERADALQSKLTVPGVVVMYVSWAIVAIGCLLVLLCVISAFRTYHGPTPPKTHPDVKAQPLEMQYKEKSEQYKHLYT